MAQPPIQPTKEQWGGRFEVRGKGRRGWTTFENGEDGDIGGIFIKLGGDLDPSPNYAITYNDFMRVKSTTLQES